jgi:tRNA nucleotidyltransferase (CCA-adding enzyme)
MNTYLVGGAVRDQLLGKAVTERDWVVVGASVADMVAAGFKPVGKDFPVFLHPETHEEYALARTERKSGHGYHGFTFYTDTSVSLADDLLRRDLTINAMALDTTGQLIDPYGGQADLHNRVLRHVSEAFRDDPLRLLRVARLAAQLHEFGFQVATDTLALMHELVLSGELQYLTPERVWAETVKALLSPAPEVFFTCLRETGALAIFYPEIDALYGVPQPAHYHPEIDTGVHSMMVLQQAARLSSKGEVRFAALLHDLGKAISPQASWPRHHGHEHAGLALVEKLCDRLRVPNSYRELAILVVNFHGLFRRVLDELQPDTIVITLQQLDAFRRPERFDDFLLACEADLRGRIGFETAAVPQTRILRELAALCRTIDSSTLQQQSGLTGKAFGAALESERIRQVSQQLEAIRMRAKSDVEHV